jgi:hypothetical protein
MRLIETGEHKSLSWAMMGYYFSLAAAVLFFIQGVLGILFRSIVFAVAISLGVGIAALLIGILLVIVALIVGSATYGLRRYPTLHVGAGATIIIFSVLALFLGGGYIIGSILGVVGGIMAIMFVLPTP